MSRTRTFVKQIIGSAALFFASNISSQEINGTWKGNSKESFWYTTASQIVIELALHDDSLLSGISHLYYKNGTYEHFKLMGKYVWKDSIAIFSESEIIDYKFGFLDFSPVAGVYKMKMENREGNLKLIGYWKKNKEGAFKSSEIQTWFTKNEEKTFFPQRDSIIEDQRKSNRATDILKVIEISEREKDSIRIDLYDNG